VDKWKAQVEKLAEVASTHGHAALAGYVFGQRHKWRFSQSTMRELAVAIAPLEEVLRNKFIPALFGDKTPISDLERALYALPARFGGLSIGNPAEECPQRYADSVETTSQLTELLLAGEAKLVIDDKQQSKVKATIKKRRESDFKATADSIKTRLSPEQKKAMELAQAKGGSALISTLPLDKLGFAFHGKRDFRDLLRMRYRKPLDRLPCICTCGAAFSLDHSQICKLGGFIHMRHNEGERLWAYTCSKIFKDVEAEPILEPLDDEKMYYKSAITTDDARSDVRVRGFWGNKQNAFFEMRYFYPFASSYNSKSLDSCFKSIAQTRKREYEERIVRVDNGSFTPMIMTTTGSMGPQMQIAVKHAARLLATKRNEPYSKVASLLQCRFAFAAMRAALICLRGSRDIRHVNVLAAIDTPAEVAVSELQLR
jgi:hypothetical protein